MIENATVVSMLPIRVYETKPGLYPGDFEIPAAELNDFNILHLGPSISRAYIDVDRGFMEKTVFADQIAQSLVFDLSKSLVGIQEDATPGIGWLPGRLTKEDIKKNHAKFLAELKAKQHAWFISLVNLADDDWNKYHSHAVISDLSRLAAERLQLKRDWITVVGNDTCIGCKSLIQAGALVCPICRTVQNKEQYAKLTSA